MSRPFAIYLLRPFALLGCFFLTTSVVLACSCWGGETFCTNLRWQHPDNHSVYRVEVLNHYFPLEYGGEFYSNLLADVRIISSLTANAPLSDTITFIGQDGVNCGFFLDDLEDGGEFIITVWNEPTYDSLTIGNPQANYIFDYPATAGLTFCGVNVMRIEGNMLIGVDGPIRPGVNSMSIDEFLADFDACRLIDVGLDGIEEELDLAVFPNPVSDVLQVSLGSGQLERLQLWSTAGQLMLEQTSFTTGVTTSNLMVTSFPPGIYLLTVYGEFGRSSRRVIVR